MLQWEDGKRTLYLQLLQLYSGIKFKKNQLLFVFEKKYFVIGPFSLSQMIPECAQPLI